LAGLTLLFWGCGGDDTETAEKCAAGTVAGAVVDCACDGDAGVKGMQTCQDDGFLSSCDCSGGAAGTNAGTAGTNGGTAGTNSGTAGTTSGTAGTTSGTAGTASDDDAGVVVPPVDGGAQTDTKPPSDGSQLSTCTTGGTACMGDLGCYTASIAGGVGYCTTTCTMDTDCAALTGATYTCSAAAVGGGLPGGGGGIGNTRYCRIACTGVDDTSCPANMACIDADGAGSFRCLYDAKDLGTGDVAIYGKCSVSGDCAGENVCYGSSQISSGFCAQPCQMDTDCTEMAATGDITPTCSTNSSACRLQCGQGDTCPDGMACNQLGRCGYAATQPDAGGI
jgi:hypothetical protein